MGKILAIFAVAVAVYALSHLLQRGAHACDGPTEAMFTDCR